MRTLSKPSCYDGKQTKPLRLRFPTTLHPKGDTIIQEGDADRSLFKFYIMEEGEARAYVLEDGEDVLMSHLRPGETCTILFTNVAYS